jgi:cell wall-associated NlpC family hydrolase
MAAAGLLLLPGRASAQTFETTVAKAIQAVAERAEAARNPARAPFGAAATSVRDSLVALARQQLGRKYVLGGADPSRGFDCSGLIRYIASALRIDVPRTAALQERAGEALPKDTSRLRPGDLITFGRGKRASHIGIYVGEGRFIHASSAAGRVIESPLDRPPAKRIKPWRGARRIVVAADSTEAKRGVGG